MYAGWTELITVDSKEVAEKIKDGLWNEYDAEVSILNNVITYTIVIPTGPYSESELKRFSAFAFGVHYGNKS